MAAFPLHALLPSLVVLAVPAAAQGSQPTSAKRMSASWRDADVRDVVRTLVAEHPASVVVPADLRRLVTVDLEHDSVRDALAAVAAAVRAELVADEYGVWHFAPAADRPAVPERRKLQLQSRDLARGMLEIAKELRLQVVVAPGAAGELPSAVDVTPGQQAFLEALPDGVAQRRRLAALLIVPRPAPAPGTRFDFVDADVPTALREIGAVAPRRIEVEPEVEGKVTMHLRDVPWRHALALAAAAGNGEVVLRPDGAYGVRRRRLVDSLGAAEQVTLNSAPDGMRVDALEGALTGLYGKPVTLVLPEASRGKRIFVSGLSGPRRSVVQAIADALFLDVLEHPDGALKLQPPRG